MRTSFRNRLHRRKNVPILHVQKQSTIYSRLELPLIILKLIISHRSTTNCPTHKPGSWTAEITMPPFLQHVNTTHWTTCLLYSRQHAPMNATTTKKKSTGKDAHVMHCKKSRNKCTACESYCIKCEICRATAHGKKKERREKRKYCGANKAEM